VPYDRRYSQRVNCNGRHRTPYRNPGDNAWSFPRQYRILRHVLVAVGRLDQLGPACKCGRLRLPLLDRIADLKPCHVPVNGSPCACCSHELCMLSPLVDCVGYSRRRIPMMYVFEPIKFSEFSGSLRHGPGQCCDSVAPQGYACSLRNLAFLIRSRRVES
jgi:hypothetical protein